MTNPAETTLKDENELNHTQHIVEGILAPHLQTINDNPELLSLLYDVNLLPEQCTSINSAVACAAITYAFRIGRGSNA